MKKINNPNNIPTTADQLWGPVGDKPDCPAKCAHCGYKRLRFQNEENDVWCRRCRYENFDLYFGDGSNKKSIK